MKIYHSVDEIIAAVDDNAKWVGSEYKTLCPFCQQIDGYGGNDRMYWRNGKPPACRQCKRKDRKSVFTYQEIIDLIDPGSVVAPEVSDFKPFDPSVYYEIEPVTYTEENVLSLHQTVKREYFYRWNWTDETIDRFKLGYGVLDPKWGKRYILPFKLHRADGHQYSEYAAELRQAKKSLKSNVKTEKISKAHFWYIHGENPKRIWLAEGPKDGISLSQMFPEDDVWVEFGSTMWWEHKADYLNKLHREVIVCGDNDDAGRSFVKDVTNSREQTTYALRFPQTAGEGYDVTDLLVAYGDRARDYILQNYYEYVNTPKGFIEDYTKIDPNYVPAEPPKTVQTLPEIRAEMRGVLHEYVYDYKRLKKQAREPIVQVLAPRPGSGKSYEMAHLAQELGRIGLTEYEQKREAVQELVDLAEDDDTKEKFQRKLDNLSPATVMYAGPFRDGWNDLIGHEGIDENLFYNYQPRNEENCQNLETVTQIVSKGYNGRAFCETACPFKNSCKWLAQDAERKKFPVLYARHNNVVTSIVDEYKYEDLTHIIETPISISLDDLNPSIETWGDYLNTDEVGLLKTFIEALRGLLAHSDTLSGYGVQHRLDELCDGKYDQIMRELHDKTVEAYQPEMAHVEDYSKLPMRCIPALWKILREEYEHYEQGLFNWNTRVHKIGLRIMLYPIEQIEIAPSKPIVIADGTALSEQYGILFNRQVRTYRPEVYSRNANLSVLYGSDFTKTSINKQIGKGLSDFKHWLSDAPESATNIFGELVDFSSIEIDENMYDSVIMERASTLIKHYSAIHKSLLVVTYKSVSDLLRFKFSHLKNIAIAHYGSLRGTNRFKDYEAVLLIGAYRQPYEDVWRRIQAWMSIKDPYQYVGPETMLKTAPYNGTFQGNTYITFNDEFADAYVNKLEVGEAVQCFERIRLYTSGVPKYAYIAANRPIGNYITSVSSMTSLVNRYKDARSKKILEFIQGHYLTNFKLPAILKIKKACNVGEKLAKEILEAYVKELGNASNA